MLKKIFFSFLALHANYSFAYEPFLTDDASTVQKNKNQLDFYFYDIFNRPGSEPARYSRLDSYVDINIPGEEFVGRDRAIAFPFGYTYGYSDNTEISFGMTYYSSPRGDYLPLTNYTVGAKYRVYGDAKDGYSFAVKPSFYFPATQNQQVAGVGMALPGFGLNLISAYDRNDYSLLFNVSYQHQPYNTNHSIAGEFTPFRTDLLQFSFAPIWNVTSQFHIGLDIGLVSDVMMTDDHRYNYFLMGAITYSPLENIDIGISYLRVAKNFENQHYTGYSSIFKTGISYRF